MKIMGIDLGIKKVAWSVWEDSLLTTTGAFVSKSHDRGTQLFEVAQTIRGQVQTHQPDHIFVEDTLIGNNRKYSIQLSQTMGAVLAFLSRAEYKNGPLENWTYPHTYQVNVSSWKKTVLGNGRAGKEDVVLFIDELNSAYHDICDGDQDQYDAACIGYYGVLTERKVAQLEAAGRSPLQYPATTA